jgi:hypothetical protein
MPPTISVVPMIQRLRKSSSMTSLSRMPRITIGSEPRMMNQPIRASRWPRYSGFTSDLAHTDPIRQMSLRKKMSTASSVPIWMTAVNAAPGSPQPNISGRIRRCALLEIGRNSVSPWIVPRTTA